MMTMAAHRTALLALAGLFAPAILAAQEPAARPDATFTATITDGQSGLPIAGASVTLDDGELGALSDARGRVRITGIAAGPHTVTVSAFGRRTERLAIDFEPGADVTGEVGLLVEAINVEPLQVLVERESGLNRVGFYRREATGLGTFMDSEKLAVDVAQGDRLSDVLRGVRGIRVVPVGGSGYRLMSTRSSGFQRGCTPSVFVDGMRIGFDDVDMLVPLEAIAGIEVFAGPAETPARFRFRSPCGAVLLWTKH